MTTNLLEYKHYYLKYLEAVNEGDEEEALNNYTILQDLWNVATDQEKSGIMSIIVGHATKQSPSEEQGKTFIFKDF